MSIQAPAAVRDLLGKMMAEINQVSWENTEKAAKANPKAYRNTNVTRNTRYGYFFGMESKKKTVHFCYSMNKNVAGYYLSWTETRTGKLWSRTNFQGWDTKRAARDESLWRAREAKKPAAERKITL